MTYFVDYTLPNGELVLGMIGMPKEVAIEAAKEMKQDHPERTVEINRCFV